MGRVVERQRTIQKVRFDGRIGYVTADELLGARASLWRHWKDMLTQGNQSPGKGYTARCVLCEGTVYIYLPNGFPAFKHFKGEGETCPWHTGTPLTPDDVRKLQYNGEQESKLHRNLCEAIFGYVRADSRCTDPTCNQRINAAEGDGWKVPDVSATFADFGRVAIELQLSNTFQTEISARTTFYNSQNIGLLWVFHGRRPDLDPLPESLNGVIHKQRGNAFVLDADSHAASEEQKTLVLKCYLKTDLGFDSGRLVRVDQLTIPAIGCMYFEDRLIPPMLSEMAALRGQWEALLQDKDSPHPDLFCSARLKELRGGNVHAEVSEQDLKFVATVLSVIAAAEGRPKQFACRLANIKAMLNTYLDPNKKTALACHAGLLEHLIRSTTCKELLNGTVGKHIRRAKDSYGKPPHFHHELRSDSLEGQLLARLAPEIFDTKRRAMLEDFGALPNWVSRPRSAIEPQ
jgi:hypothetical protein